MTIYSLGILLSQFGASLLFHVQFWLFLPELHTDFSRDRSGGVVFPSLSESFTVCCDPHNQRLWHSQWNRSRCFGGTLLFFDDPVDVGNLISGSSTSSKPSVYGQSQRLPHLWVWGLNALICRTHWPSRGTTALDNRVFLKNINLFILIGG